MTSPTPPSARQVAIAMLQAAEEGKTVQCHSVIASDPRWTDVEPDTLMCIPLPDFSPMRYEWRIKPTTESVKAMELYVDLEEGASTCASDPNCRRYQAHTTRYMARMQLFREVIPSHDAEIAELRRNEAALKRAIQIFQGSGLLLKECLDECGAHL